jgi:hypothetical protein
LRRSKSDSNIIEKNLGKIDRVGRFDPHCGRDA